MTQQTLLVQDILQKYCSMPVSNLTVQRSPDREHSTQGSPWRRLLGFNLVRKTA